MLILISGIYTENNFQVGYHYPDSLKSSQTPFISKRPSKPVLWRLKKTLKLLKEAKNSSTLIHSATFYKERVTELKKSFNRSLHTKY